MNKQQLTDAFIFMKVGNHAGETFEDILKRKKREYEKTGMTFWGYGGVACHPVKQVRPFAMSQFQRNGNIYLLMNTVKSNFNQPILPAKQYSIDGVNWQDIPKGINVTGSKYALVLDEIKPTDFEINLDEFRVGIGPSSDKIASDYLQGRTDKACLTIDPYANPGANTIRKIDFAAKLQDPYAVILKY